MRTTIIVLDAARPHPFAASGTQLAGGLALVEPEPGVLVAFNAAPDTVAPDQQGPYGPYAQALAEMMREGGVPLAEVFERVRLRVNELTHGAEVPWHASKVQEPYLFFERGPDAPPPPVSFEEKTAFRVRPIRDLDAQDAYLAALERDTLEGYIDFLDVYPDDPMAGRVRAIIAARREAITWRRTRAIDTPEAYWSYLRRYPRGRHAWEARRRLAFLSAVLEPPPSFRIIDYEVPPPPPEEFIYVERRQSSARRQARDVKLRLAAKIAPTWTRGRVSSACRLGRGSLLHDRKEICLGLRATAATLELRSLFDCKRHVMYVAINLR